MEDTPIAPGLQNERGTGNAIRYREAHTKAVLDAHYRCGGFNSARRVQQRQGVADRYTPCPNTDGSANGHSADGSGANYPIGIRYHRHTDRGEWRDDAEHAHAGRLAPFPRRR